MIGVMARKPNPPRDDPAQSKRFIDMAREVEAEGSKEDLGRALKKIAPRSQQPQPKDH